jgi:hypothetical protein
MRLANVLWITVAVSVSAWAADPFVGTWKVNVEKSRTTSGKPAQPGTQTFEATSDGYRFTFPRCRNQ